MAWKEIPTNDNVNDYYMSWSARLWIRAASLGQTIWNYPSTTYGPNYYQWMSFSYTGTNGMTGMTVDVTDGLEDWLDSSNPQIIVPTDSVVKSFEVGGNMTNGERVGFSLVKGTPNWNSGSNQLVSMDKVGNAGFSIVATTNNYHKGSITYTTNNSVSAGDIIIPQWKKMSNLTSTATVYMEACVNITLTKV